MAALMEALEDLILDHWAKLLLGALILVIGRWWGRVKAQKEWQAKEFKGRMMVSLNSIHDGMLHIRTILEKDAGEILLNQVAVKVALKEAEKTTEEDPVVHLPQEDRWHILNAVLNEIAEQFKAGTVARDMGLSTSSCVYSFCLTNEVAGALKTRKLRVMMIQRDILESEDLDFQSLRIEQPQHETRIKTLQAMRAAKKTCPEDFMDVEITLSAP